MLDLLRFVQELATWSQARDAAAVAAVEALLHALEIAIGAPDEREARDRVEAALAVARDSTRPSSRLAGDWATAALEISADYLEDPGSAGVPNPGARWRAHAVEALLRVPPITEVEHALRVLTYRGSHEELGEAVRVILGSSAESSALVECLEAPHEAARAEALRRMPSTALGVRALLVIGLGDVSDVVATSAASALTYMTAPGAVTALAFLSRRSATRGCLRGDRSTAERAAEEEVLGLEAAMGGADAELRRQVARTLMYARNREANAVLAALCDDADPRLRTLAMTGLARLECNWAWERVSAARRDPDPQVRKLAAQLLGIEQPGPPTTPEITRSPVSSLLEGAEALIGALTSTDPLTRERATRRLGWIGDTAFTAVLADCLGDPDPCVRGAAAGALRRLSAPETADRLAAALLEEGYWERFEKQQPPQEAREVIAVALGAMGAERHLELFFSRASEVRFHGGLMLLAGRLSPPVLAPILERVIRNGTAAQAGLAVRCCQFLPEPQEEQALLQALERDGAEWLLEDLVPRLTLVGGPESFTRLLSFVRPMEETQRFGRLRGDWRVDLAKGALLGIQERRGDEVSTEDLYQALRLPVTESLSGTEYRVSETHQRLLVRVMRKLTEREALGRFS